MTDSLIPLAPDDRVYLISLAIDTLGQTTDLATARRLTDLGYLIDAGDVTPEAARDFFELVERYGPSGDGPISFAGRSHLARALAQLAPHALRLAGGLGRLRLALLRHEGPSTLAREKVFPPFKMHVMRDGHSCEITVELWTYAEAEARLPNEIWHEMQHHTNDTGSVFVAMDGDTVVAVSVNKLDNFITNIATLKPYEGTLVLNGGRLEKFEDAYSRIGICFILARLQFMENLGLTTNRNDAAPLLVNIQLSRRIFESWQYFAGIPDSPEQTQLRQAGIITYGFALKVKESAIKAQLLLPIVSGHPAAQNPQPATMIPWESDAVYEVLKKLSPDYLARVLSFFMSQYQWLAHFFDVLRASAKFAEWPQGVRTELLAFESTANPVMRAAEQFQSLGRDDDALLSHRYLLERLENMAALKDVLCALEPLAPMAPLVAEADPQTMGKLLRDGDHEPHLVYLRLGVPSWVSWQARLSVIASYLQTYPRVHVVVDVKEAYVHLLDEILREMGMVRPEHTEHIVLIDSSQAGDKHPPQWARDAVLYMEPQEGPPVAVLRKATGVEFSGLISCMDAVGIPHGEDDGSYPDAGNIVMGSDFALVGISEALLSARFNHLQPELREQLLDQWAKRVGRKIIFVGDPLQGQALYHLDLYMSVLPNDTIVVTDFRLGWDWLKSLQPSQLDNLRSEYFATIAAPSQILENHFTSTAGLQNWWPNFLVDLQKNDAALMAYVEEIFLPHVQGLIDREIASLQSLGFRVERVMGFPLPSVVGGLTFNNATQHRKVDGTPVLHVPSAGKTVDAKVHGAFRAAGFGGDIVEVPGVIDSQLVLAGGPQCMTTVTPMMKPAAEEAAVAATDLEPATDTPPDDSVMTTDAPTLHNDPHWHHSPAAGSHGVSRAVRFTRL